MPLIISEIWRFERMLYLFNKASIIYSTYYEKKNLPVYNLQEFERLVRIRIYKPFVEIHVLCVNDLEARLLVEHIEDEYDTDTFS